MFAAVCAALLLALPAAASTAAHRHRGSVHVRHETIHRAPHNKCSRHKAKRHAKHGAACRPHKKGAHHTHKRRVHHRRRRPATASADCPGANLVPQANDIEDAVAATLCLVNDERARFGESALTEDPRLTSVAVGHSRDMDALDYFAHVSPDGQTLLMRVQASGFIPNGNVGYTIGENIAWGTLSLGTPRAIVQAWMESPGHRANILNGSFHYTGVGIDPALPHSMSGGQAGGMYTQDFGTIIQ
jgi:uncharacterized protein YkwD